MGGSGHFSPQGGPGRKNHCPNKQSVGPHLAVLHKGTLDACLLPKLVQDHSDTVAVLLLQDVLDKCGLLWVGEAGDAQKRARAYTVCVAESAGGVTKG